MSPPKTVTIALTKESLMDLAAAARAAIEMANERTEEANKTFEDFELGQNVLCGIAFDIERRNTTVSKCAYCGAESTFEHAVLQAHMASCAKHPLREALTALRVLVDLIEPRNPGFHAGRGTVSDVHAAAVALLQRFGR